MASSSVNTWLTIVSGPIGDWCDKYKQKFIDASLTLAFKSVVFLMIFETKGMSSFFIWAGYRYLKNMGSDFCISSSTLMKFLSTGSLHPSSIKSRNTMKFSSIGKFFLLISQLIASLLLGSKLWICSLTLSIAAYLADQN